MAEDFGVEDRGHFYDPVGALRDVVVNHLMQVVSAAAMEPPSGGTRRRSRMPRSRCSAPSSEADPVHYVRGQYEGYLDIDGVAPHSTTETYAALRLDIDNWRWSGVPFFIRAGKRLPVTQTELRLVFKQPPRLGFGFGPSADRAGPARDQARPVDRYQAPGQSLARGHGRPQQPSTWTWSSPTRAAKDRPRTRCCSMPRWSGSTRFTRQDGVEETWRIMQPLLDAPPPVHSYPSGSWGPVAADELTAGFGGWHRPWVVS